MHETKISNSFQQTIKEQFETITVSFMDLSSELNRSQIPELDKKIEQLFRKSLEWNRIVSGEIKRQGDELNKLQSIVKSLKEEKKRLEVLYSSGILFSSETEKSALMEIAIETVVRELGADAGFIILNGEKGRPDQVFAKNMEPAENPDAMEMSTTVIGNTLKELSPIKINDTAADDDIANKASIIKLGISSVLCVPLVLGSNVMGAVYIDRRNKDNPFSQHDLMYLLAFAKQIVKGLEISLEISTLEKKLINDAIQKFEDLRREFRCSNIIGQSRRLFEVVKVAARISATDASVIILGENGTGKDVLARAIHENSKRADAPFVTIDCSSIPGDLLESELFGYESGAFTGAVKSKPGKLETADGGTLFFDEIGEMNINLQAKLLRVLQTREIERLGSVNTKKIDVRVICATNRNIHELIAQGRFREDLYYRLKVIELTLPPLRQRKEDIDELIKYFLNKHAAGRGFKLTPEALEILEEYHWPGNIRELENVVLRCIVLAKDSVIGAEDLPSEIVERQNDDQVIKTGRPLADAENEFRRMYIIRTLRQTNSKSEAAKLLGINRTHFYKLLAQLEIEI